MPEPGLGTIVDDAIPAITCHCLDDSSSSTRPGVHPFVRHEVVRYTVIMGAASNAGYQLASTDSAGAGPGECRSANPSNQVRQTVKTRHHLDGRNDVVEQADQAVRRGPRHYGSGYPIAVPKR